MSKYCGDCGKENRDSNNFCIYCGWGFGDNVKRKPKDRINDEENVEKPSLNIFTNVGRCYKKFGVFSGRAPRSEYWYFILYFWVSYFMLIFVDAGLGVFTGESSIGFFSLLFYIGNIIPLLAVLTRRLHDVGMSGWWVIGSLIPFVSLAVLIAVMFKSEPDNKYGQSPTLAVR